jgi:putative oxidoreductase
VTLEGDTLLIDVALLVLRLVVGLYLAAHGAQKLFGWFGGPGLGGTIQGMDTHMRFRPAWMWGTLVALSEVVGGVLMAIGLLGPIGPTMLAGAMFVATFVAHWNQGPWGAKGGYELTLTNLAVMVAVALVGVGRYSVDAWLGLSVPSVVAEGLAVLVVLSILVAIVTRRAAEPQARTA